MHVTLVHVIVKAEYIDKFIEACRLNHQASIQESGNFRFDILQNAETPQKFVLYESYKSVEDAAAHKNTSHYLNWRETVANWMVEPRQGVRYQGLFPRV
ncbi:MAG: antibiotic biosynthesis monooxygenase [Gammaproteobacteria bacterium]|nr:antibiotic biosynthesis monooxygenase [Gammaproteobacteria bacterium]MDH5731921.1 antibiotic biosynthesis monooxygenase [Gammaproteobacteria bacterium]